MCVGGVDKNSEIHLKEVLLTPVETSKSKFCSRAGQQAEPSERVATAV